MSLKIQIEYYLMIFIYKSLLFGIKYTSGNQTQQNYFEKLKVKTESAFVNKKFQVN